MIAECFGRLHYATIAGRIQPIVVTLESIGLPAVGALRDWAGSYTAAFCAIIAANLIAMALVAGLDVDAQPPPDRHPRARRIPW